ncbi:MAG: hypothetical protein ABI741_11000 [Ferruginibacter sp.]
MQKNLYFRSVLRRDNLIKLFFLGLFGSIASYPRLLIEVFIRKDFGERYFNLASAIYVALFMAALPLAAKGLMGYFGDDDSSSFWWHYLTWYIFLALFLIKSFQHYQTMKRSPSVFDFARYSLSSGKFHPQFFKIQIPGIKPNTRNIEILLEPGLFFVLGIVLWLIGQKVGILITVCSIFYSFSYQLAYHNGDNFIMDKIDEIICNEELKKTFVDDATEDETRGFRFMGRKPESKEMREQIMPLMLEKDEVFDAK